MTIQKAQEFSPHPTGRATRSSKSPFSIPVFFSYMSFAYAKRTGPFIIIFLIIIIALSFVYLDNSWYDTQWGGDTGEETYQAPLEPEEPEPENYWDNCCGNTIFIGGVVFTAIGVKLHEHKKK